MATINALQTTLNKLYSFPCCPKETRGNPLEAYFNNLKVGCVFAYNDDSPKLLIHKFAKAKNCSSILVMCEREGRTCERKGFMPWLIAEIKFENGKYRHYKLATYFEKYDASRAFCSQEQGE